MASPRPVRRRVVPGNNLALADGDRFTNLQRQPKDGGSLVFQYGTYTYRMVEPVTEKKKDEGSNLGLILGVAGGVAALAGLAALFVTMRRRSTADERE